MKYKLWFKMTLLILLTCLIYLSQVIQAQDTDYPIVDTGQTTCYDDSGAEIACPAEGKAFYGQDAQYNSNQPSYTDNGDGTITDNVTGLMWQQTADTDGDGDTDAADKLTYAKAGTYCENLSLAGYDDWQLPDIKQLYSLIDFSGIDPSGYNGTDTSGLTPFIDTNYFDFAYGDTNANERIIDSQYASSSLYVGDTQVPLLFGVNFADGRIKGYGITMFGQDKTFSVACIRENSSYGINDFSDNGDSTITDNATGLMWAQDDSGEGLNWEEALAWVETQNDANYLGYNDWRLSNAKELQSIVDYSRSPDSTDSAAIDPLFNATSITNEGGQTDYAFYWSSTTHINWTNEPGRAGVYVSFGRALGYENETWSDVHGAGAQRSDPKSGDPDDYPTGHGPQGDAIRIYNYVRLVRDADTTVTPTAKLSIAKTVAAANAEVQPGDAVTYTVTVANNGTADATGVVVTDTLPAAVMGDDLNWTGVITAGEHVAFTIPATIKSNTLYLGQTIVNTAYYSHTSGRGSESASFTIPTTSTVTSYTVMDTGQSKCYNNDGAEITCPAEGKSFYGQDAQYTGRAFDFTDNGDDTVTDNVTGLMWQQTPSNSQYSWADAQTTCELLLLAEYDDWRAPSLKELFSISDFETGWPYINTDYFSLVNAPELKQQQYWSSNHYEVGTTHDGMPSAFGMNHGTGHIKAYPDGSDGAPMAAKYVRCVRGDDYGINDFVNNGDPLTGSGQAGTITDNATGLMWLQDDSGVGVDWEDALAYADGFSFAGYDDWRLPNVKELQSIVDYSGVYPAIDLTYFNVTDDDAYFWSSTSAYFGPESPDYYYGWYVAFGYAVNAEGEDMHGAGAVRFDTKVEGGPAGEDPERVYNYVRLVRDADSGTAKPPRNYKIYIPLTIK